MKKFSFRLERVMEWRRTQARIEEAKLEGLFAEIRGIDRRQAALQEERTKSESELLAEPTATGMELAALDAFRRFSIAEHVRLEGQRADCRRRISAQLQEAARKRRDVRLLERLKEKRHKTWTLELDRETEKQAGESYLARWKPEPL
jgi:hypothetical protein